MCGQESNAVMHYNKNKIVKRMKSLKEKTFYFIIIVLHDYIIEKFYNINKIVTEHVVFKIHINITLQNDKLC